MTDKPSNGGERRLNDYRVGQLEKAQVRSDERLEKYIEKTDERIESVEKSNIIIAEAIKNTGISKRVAGTIIVSLIGLIGSIAMALTTLLK